MTQESNFNPNDNPEMRWAIGADVDNKVASGQAEASQASAGGPAPKKRHGGNLSPEEGQELPVEASHHPLQETILTPPDDVAYLMPQTSDANQTPPNWGATTEHAKHRRRRIASTWERTPLWAKITAGIGAPAIAATGIALAVTSGGKSSGGTRPVAVSSNNPGHQNTGHNQQPSKQSKAPTTPKPTDTSTKTNNSTAVEAPRQNNGEIQPTSAFSLDRLSQGDLEYLASIGVTQNNLAGLENKIELINSTGLAEKATTSPAAAIKGAYRDSVEKAYEEDNAEASSIMIFGVGSELSDRTETWMRQILDEKHSLENRFGNKTKLIFSIEKPHDTSLASSYPQSKIKTPAGTNIKTAKVSMFLAIAPQDSSNAMAGKVAELNDVTFTMMGLPGNNGRSVLWLINNEKTYPNNES